MELHLQAWAARLDLDLRKGRVQGQGVEVLRKGFSESELGSDLIGFVAIVETVNLELEVRVWLADGHDEGLDGHVLADVETIRNKLEVEGSENEWPQFFQLSETSSCRSPCGPTVSSLTLFVRSCCLIHSEQ